jgi:predicted O-methyltransferase YrrM
VDVSRFLDELPGLFDVFPRSRAPRGRGYDDILAAVPNLSTENILATLNLAASLLGEGESYVEVGSYAGASLIGAMRGNAASDFVAVDHFGGRGWLAATRRDFDANVARLGATQATVLEGDAFAVLESDRLAGRRVGVLFWDADHSHDGQLRGLRAIERHLAAQALVICDNADWSGVVRAVEDWCEEQPAARLALELQGRDGGQPWWHDGLRILAWQRPAGPDR